MSLTEFLIVGLAVWRISSLLVHEDGPFDLLGKMRHSAGVRYDEHSERYGQNELANMLNCVWCTSFWVALIVVGLYWLVPTTTVVACSLFACSAVAVIVESFVDHG